MTVLPPLRLTGAMILRDGAMIQRSVSISGGRIVRGPLPAVNLGGYLLLPGIIDMQGTTFQQHLRGGDPAENDYDIPSALCVADHLAASAGITTSWIAQGWSWAGGHHSPDIAEALLRARARYRRDAMTDQRVQLQPQTHLVDQGPRLLAAIGRWGVDCVMFRDDLPGLQDMAQQHAQQFASTAFELRQSPEKLLDAVRVAAQNSRQVPRHLCNLAQGFDEMGVVYGSHGDTSAENREHFSMIGARISQCPAAHAAAAAAQAMGDPVLMGATELLRAVGGRVTIRGAFADRLTAGLCDALVSDGQPQSLAKSAFALVDQGICDLPRAWALISARPAEIMRLADRGTLDPGRRADLVIIDPATRRIEATICAGRLAHMSGNVAARFLAHLDERPQMACAAE